ncbi:family 78 glycoside hydrolase catalytic domain [Planctomicrobium sp. SH661]|uniref:family 78 glycoside hydrolase catalytic domain n=1 Tax=Planctomicrobium sp. SH661 TaxID=3448124 RepID=UPI003F5B7BD7
MKVPARCLLIILVIASSLPELAGSESACGLELPSRLRCESLENPQGIDVPQPRLSWQLQSSGRSQRQTAYQILVASSPDLLAADRGDLWDSGKVNSGKCSLIPYQGNELRSGQALHWKVRVWDVKDVASGYSAPAKFSTGLLDPEDWAAKWIASPEEGSPLMRKSFVLDRPVRRAVLYISGIGYCEPYLNGEKVGDHVLDPSSTYYTNDQPWPLTDRVLYVTHDVTQIIQPGENALGAMLGHGWYSADRTPPGRQVYGDRPRLLAQLIIEHPEGEPTVIATDNTWQSHPGPVTANEICLGEDYDARLESRGWNTPAALTSDWRPAIEVEVPSPNLSAQMLPPCRVVSSLPAVKLTETAPGVYLFDFGQHFSGWTQLKVTGDRGRVVTLRHAGAVFPDGSLDTRSHYAATQTDQYTLRGNADEVWEPRFTLHGFRYVEMRGFPGTPTLETLVGRHVRNAVEISGTFECSNPLLNQLQSNIQWTLATSFQGIPQDAAERPERMGWLGDTGFVAEEYFVNFDTAAFWTKWLQDIRDTQRPNGDVSVICPIHLGRVPGLPESKAWRGAPDWTSTYPLLVWYMYWYYGDQRIVEEHYEPLKRLVAWYESQADDGILGSVLGDHMEPQDDGSGSYLPLRTPADLTTTCYYFRVVTVLQQMAQMLGHTDDAAHYVDLAKRIQTAFHSRFFNAATNVYGTGSQASLAVPLEMAIVPAEFQADVLQALIHAIEEKDDHFSTGIIGTRGVSEALSRHNRSDVMFRLATQTTYPSWGDQIQKGATSIWESFGGAYANTQHTHSLNMKMFCNASKFLHQELAGLAPTEAGYKRVQIHPQVVGGMISASSTQQTPQGRFHVAWRSQPETFELQVTIPPGTVADVKLPVGSLEHASVMESGQMIWTSGSPHPGPAGIHALQRGDSTIDLTIDSGTYAFSVNNDR